MVDALRSGCWVVLVAVMGLFVTASGVLAAPYILQPGDTLRISITELPALDGQSTIDLDGNVQVPRLGLFPAAGKTLAELDEAISLAAAGQTIPIYNSEGERLTVTLVGTEILVEIISYRPIYVTGDVARAGAVDFKPGMTVRTAIASVGGLSTVSTLFEDALQDGPGLLSAFQTATLEHGALVVRLWGIDATLEGRADRLAEVPTPVFIAPAALERLFQSERRRVELMLREANVTRNFLRQQLAYLTERVDRLNEELGNTEQALQLEEGDVDRIRQLQERGLAAAARLSDARQALLLVSSRVLGVQDSVARFTLEREQIAERLATFNERFEQPLIAERSELLAQIWSMESRIDAARRALEINGQAVEAFGIDLKPSVSITIRRGVAPNLTVIEADLDSAVRPGDVIEVDVAYDYRSLSIDPPQPAVPAPSPLPDPPASAPTRLTPEQPLPRGAADRPESSPQTEAAAIPAEGAETALYIDETPPEDAAATARTSAAIAPQDPSPAQSDRALESSALISDTLESDSSNPIVGRTPVPKPRPNGDTINPSELVDRL